MTKNIAMFTIIVLLFAGCKGPTTEDPSITLRKTLYTKCRKIPKEEIKIFLEAVQAGNLDTVKQMIENRPDIVHVGEYYYELHGTEVFFQKFGEEAFISFETSPLCLAAATGQTEIATLLLSKGACVDGNPGLYDNSIVRRGPYAPSPLHFAILMNHEAIVKLLLDYGARTRFKTYSFVMTPEQAKLFGIPVTDNSKERIEKGKDIILKWTSPDSLAVCSENENLILFFNQHKKNLDEFINAIQAEDAKKLSELIAKKPTFINARSYADDTLLHIATEIESKNMVALLLSNGAFVSPKDVNHQTPLFISLENNNLDLAKFLIEHCANIDTRGFLDDSPLHQAVREDNQQIIRFLIDHNAHIDTPNRDGDTPLHLAAEWDNRKMLKFLLSCGADTEIKNNRDKTPEDIILSKHKKEIWEYSEE